MAAPNSVLQKWQEAWSSANYKAKCEKFFANRHSETGAKYSGFPGTAGDLFTSIVISRGWERRGRDPQPQELFKATHKKKGTKELGDARARSIHECFI
ncbi:hypothetical protein GH714_010644 [Hevea brasiliensis]|uniref:Uncharacterized protein n=1 Tax=Hevea brasiliensis TaxID=3981 RepID=A0A6A6M4K2_HEVBR|nr:hypothetical protein GH714_010644 [Hevea brasiliensis]